MLDDNEHQGLDSFEASLAGTLDDGSQVYSGTRKVPKDDDDPRHFVIVEPQTGKTGAVRHSCSCYFEHEHELCAYPK
jgi:hypothetical protein